MGGGGGGTPVHEGYTEVFVFGCTGCTSSLIQPVEDGQ